MGRASGQAATPSSVVYEWAISNTGNGVGTASLERAGLSGSLSADNGIVPFDGVIEHVRLDVTGVVPGTGAARLDVSLQESAQSTGLTLAFPAESSGELDVSIPVTRGQTICARVQKTVALDVAATNVYASMRVRRA